MGKWYKKIEQWVGGSNGGSGRISAFRWLIILGLVGVAIVLFNSFVNVKKVENENIGREPPSSMLTQETFQNAEEQLDSFGNIEGIFESNIKDILEKIVGVGTVDVLVTVDSTEEIVIQRNVKDTQQTSEENDSNGGKRSTTQYTRDGEIVTYESSGSETPIITKKVKPQVRGVLIVAKGAENQVVRNLIVDAVAKGLNVPSYRISVVPRKQE
ncbi:stage III sporulation protein AG [Paenibacillus crassostreae]|uniref:Stage III sporulation protein AG n=1 Tax=Paenibacillus crassostreae TaxID=1763538 RepID=A0A167DHI8_9BACL|nr:stage III sporulation protein AG [Paenibacillus crassostreae]AOZ91462.1 stage III sporulation protein AG [Paenibacillus crassostreae]OAB74379.1 stage III sporulation protein AG [Paenibacillus crassostreae]